jgi:hypothetical protein
VELDAPGGGAVMDLIPIKRTGVDTTTRPLYGRVFFCRDVPQPYFLENSASKREATGGTMNYVKGMMKATITMTTTGQTSSCILVPPKTPSIYMHQKWCM